MSVKFKTETPEDMQVMAAYIALAKKSFWEYAKLMAPDFYKENRTYLHKLADTLQEFVSKDTKNNVLVINMPPRHGKSRTASLFIEWLFGHDTSYKIMTASYNTKLSTQFSKAVRDTIQEQKGTADRLVYHDIFPNTKIKSGDASMNLWSLVGAHNNYLATSPGGTATGFGADIEVIDDLIRGSAESKNRPALDAQYNWFTDTMLSRLENGGKVIIIMTRWALEDLAGKVLARLPDIGFSVKHINWKAYDPYSKQMLCDDVLSHDEYLRKTKAMSQEVAKANFQQEPIDIQGTLYKQFKTYTAGHVPTRIRKIWSYTDTADTGSDYLCSYVFGEGIDKNIYILDCLYTQDPMEITEKTLPALLVNNKVNEAVIEANNGGRGFARRVKSKVTRTYVRTINTTKNKDTRIYSNAAQVQDRVIWPDNWKGKWPELYDALTTYQASGKNLHDDAPDALTGVIETMQNKAPSNGLGSDLDLFGRMFG